MADIILIGNHHKELLRFNNFLAKEFEIKDLGNLKYFLGMEIARSQRKYVVDLLKCQRWRLQLSKIEAPIIKDGGFKYGSFKLSIIWPPTLHFFFLVR